MRDRHRYSNGTRSSMTWRERTYLPVLYYLAQRDEPVIAARVVRWLRVSPPTVTQALQQFTARGLIVRDPRGAITLTTAGVALAETVVRRHHILERFLFDVVGMPWHLVHQEALYLEPAMSPTLEERIMALVGDAATCPHGNPIPGRAANTSQQVRLDQAAAGSALTIRQVAEEAEENTDLLRYLAEHLLLPGTRVQVIESSPISGVALHLSCHRLSISPDVAAVLWSDPAVPEHRSERPAPGG